MKQPSNSCVIKTTAGYDQKSNPFWLGNELQRKIRVVKIKRWWRCKVRRTMNMYIYVCKGMDIWRDTAHCSLETNTQLQWHSQRVTGNDSQTLSLEKYDWANILGALTTFKCGLGYAGIKQWSVWSGLQLEALPSTEEEGDSTLHPIMMQVSLSWSKQQLVLVIQSHAQEVRCSGLRTHQRWAGGAVPGSVLFPSWSLQLFFFSLFFDV